jgi:hypothetical protein
LIAPEDGQLMSESLWLQDYLAVKEMAAFHNNFVLILE